MADYKCPNCGKEFNWYDGSMKKDPESGFKLCGKCKQPLVYIKTGEIVGGSGQKPPKYDYEMSLSETVFCRDCGSEISRRAEICPKCGIRQTWNQEVNDIWYLVPIFFGIIGGIIAYGINQERDPEKAKSMLWIGVSMTIIGWFFLSFLF